MRCFLDSISLRGLVTAVVSRRRAARSDLNYCTTAMYVCTHNRIGVGSSPPYSQQRQDNVRLYPATKAQSFYSTLRVWSMYEYGAAT
jgi:hypothetical protein